MSRQSTLGMHQQLEAVTDLATLPSVSDDIVVSCIRERFMADTTYTNVGTSGLVAVNPHKYVPSNSDSVLQKYATEYRDTASSKVLLPPHIFQLANNAYYHMRRTAQDQCIILRSDCFLCSCVIVRLIDVSAERRAVESRRTVALPSRLCWI